MTWSFDTNILLEEISNGVLAIDLRQYSSLHSVVPAILSPPTITDSTISWVPWPEAPYLVMYELRFEGGHCNATLNLPVNRSTSTVSVLETDLGLDLGAGYTVHIRAVNLFTSGGWSEPRELCTPTSR